MKKKQPNLFINTRHLTDRKEDHLTEFFAALLMSSPSFRKGYEKLVLSRFFRKQGWNNAQIIDVETQCHYEEAKRIPDVILHLSNGKKIACEHKIEALETGKDEEMNPNQLWDYLHLPDISGLVYIRSNWKPPQKRVIDHSNYIKPEKSAHFQWRDFYKLLKDDSTAMGKCMKGAFEYLGYTPPVAFIGEMSGPNPKENKKNRENYKKLMSDTRFMAHELGWKYEGGSIEGHYFFSNPSANSSQVLSTASKSERFLFRVTPNEGQMATVKAKLEATCHELLENVAIPTDLNINTIVRKEGKTKVIDITTTLRDIVGENANNAPDIEKRLLEFHAPLLLALQK